MNSDRNAILFSKKNIKVIIDRATSSRTMGTESEILDIPMTLGSTWKFLGYAEWNYTSHLFKKIKF